ncbi:PREDICTED: claudin-5 [Nanorana parkeri]|uniref:claudin-5 n=1 Tax=Nanorana parkeri TaxID=125878 RepID=UPI000854C156|nr:PREDICTED: claudin-5 [Nanorana parkeri]XP_018412461.1 PREDICTED: claudin-5 [Nanorana parkeri]
MGSIALEIFGMSMSTIGWVGVILACALPMWQVSAFIEQNIVVAQFIWEGLWMSCAVQSTGQMQCKVYDSILALPPELQAGRALTVMASIVGLIGLMVTVVGAQCTICYQGTKVKSRVLFAGGIIYILTGLLVLIPLCWTANIVIREFYDPHVPSSKKREMGAALYVGWAATALLLLGGVLLCFSCPMKGQFTPPVRYSASRRPTSNGEYDKKNYV